MPLSLFAKSIAAATSAALLLAGPVAANAQARPHAHPAPSHKPASHKPVTRSHDRLTGPKRGATHAVNAQLRAVAALQSQAAAFTGTDGAALQTALAADHAAIQADLAGITAATSVRALRALVSSAVVTRQIARTQSLDVIAADTASTQGATLAATVSALSTSLANLAAAGTDTTTGDAAVADATTQLTTLSTDVPAIVSTVLAVGPTAPASTLHLAATSAGEELIAITTALTAATADITTIQTTYGL